MAETGTTTGRSLIVGEQLPMIGDGVDPGLTVARAPYDTEAHTRRIRGATDDHATYVALVDLFIASPVDEPDLRRRLLAESRGRLHADQVRYLQRAVESGLSANDPIPDPSGSLLWTGVMEGLPLVVPGADPIVAVAGSGDDAAGGPQSRRSADADGTAPVAGRRRRNSTIVLVAAAVVLIAVGIVAVVIGGGDGTDERVTAPPAAVTTVVAPVTTTAATTAAVPTTAPSTTAPPTTASATTVPSTTVAPPVAVPLDAAPDDETARTRLAATVAHDRDAVDGLHDTWVPQIASLGGPAGTTDRTRVWDGFRAFKQQFPDALLLDSGVFPSMIPGYLVVVVPESSDRPETALAWCAANGLARTDCYAQLLAPGPVDGPTSMYQ